jgi:large subunit ribosomal protein L15
MMRLHNLRPRPGARHRVKRLGCGESSGHGKTSGKGHKGQKARSGGSIRIGFEGGQMPLIRRLPKRGFNNAAFHRPYAIVNLDDLGRFNAGSTVNEQALRESKVVRGDFDGIKILGDGELKHGLTIEADKVSASARAKIEKAGGTVTLRDRRPGRWHGLPGHEHRQDAAATAMPPGTTTKSAAEKPKAKSVATVKARAKKKSSRKQ